MGGKWGKVGEMGGEGGAMGEMSGNGGCVGVPDGKMVKIGDPQEYYAPVSHCLLEYPPFLQKPKNFPFSLISPHFACLFQFPEYCARSVPVAGRFFALVLNSTYFCAFFLLRISNVPLFSRELQCVGQQLCSKRQFFASFWHNFCITFFIPF